MSSIQARQALRQQLRQRRIAIPVSRREKLSFQLAKQLQSLPRLRYAQYIGAYEAMGSEICAAPWMSQQGHKRLYVPKLHGQSMRFYPRSIALRRNRHGIAEPYRGRARPAWALSLLLVPLLGFDQHGNRMGQGGGYYDRTLGRLTWRKPYLLGLAFDEQFCEHIPTASWDQPLDAVATPTQIRVFRK